MDNKFDLLIVNAKVLTLAEAGILERSWLAARVGLVIVTKVGRLSECGLFAG